MSERPPNLLTTSVELFKNLNIDLKNDRQTKEALVRKINVLTGEILQARKKLAEAEINVLEANTEAESLKKQLEQLDEKLKALQAKHNVVEEALASSRSKVRSANEKLAEKDRALFDAKDELSRQRAAYKELESNLEFTQRTLENGDSHLHKLETKNSKLKYRLNQLSRENASLKKTLSKSGSMFLEVKESVANFQTKMISLKAQLEQEIAIRDKRLSRAFEKLKQLAVWTRKCGAQLKRRLGRESKLKKKIASFEKIFEMHRKRDSRVKDSAQATIKNQLRKIRELGQQKKELERSLSTLKTDSSYKIGLMKENLDGVSKQFKTQCDQFQADIYEAREQLDSERRENGRLQTKLEQEKKDARRLRERMDDMDRLKEWFLSMQLRPELQIAGSGGSGAVPRSNRSRKTDDSNEKQSIGESSSTKEYNTDALHQRLGDLIHKMEQNMF